jgi:hypothetical protein
MLDPVYWVPHIYLICSRVLWRIIITDVTSVSDIMLHTLRTSSKYVFAQASTGETAMSQRCYDYWCIYMYYRNTGLVPKCAKTVERPFHVTHELPQSVERAITCVPSVTRKLPKLSKFPEKFSSLTRKIADTVEITRKKIPANA